MLRSRCLFLFLFSFCCISVRGGDSITFTSTGQKTFLLELFTSQGCSSCPPAERWLNRLIEDRGLWRNYVPVAFHVSYWDRLGWADPFASEAHTQRQYSYFHSGNMKSVYTPCILLDGVEWRKWRSQRDIPPSKQSAGVLRAHLESDQINITYSDKGKPVTFHIALLGFGLETHVKRGENRNRHLAQEFIVLTHESRASDTGSVRTRIPKNTTRRTASRFALALWVSSTDDPKPLQATGGWLPIEISE